MRYRVFLRATAVVAAIIAVGVPAIAQTSTGTIRVVAADADGGVLPGVTCSAQTADQIVRRTAVTGPNGEVLLSALQPSDQYVVSCSLQGFAGTRNENVHVTSGQTTTLRIGMQLAEISEEVTVIAESPLVDVTSAVTGQEITLEMTEALPTGRSYQSYLQLVPGVAPDFSSSTGNSSGNPAVRSGINYSDIGGEVGLSTDNFYYIEGINVTDGVTGTFGANLNTEIIQEQKVFTGGIPAEFVGAAGLVSNVVTKSGGSSYSGSLRYDLEDDSFVEDNDHSPNAKFSRDDIAATIGGPLWPEHIWFFGSYREIDRSDDITTLDTGAFLRTVERNDEQAFFKGSWAVNESHNFTATYMDDPAELTGSTSRTVVTNRDRAQEQGGERYIANYTGLFGPTVLSLAGGKHNGEVSSFAAVRDPFNEIIFRRSDASTLQQQQLGGFGEDNISERDTEFVKGDFEWFLTTGPADHNIKIGADMTEYINIRDRQFTAPQYRGSLAPSLAGITAGELATLAAGGQLTNSFFRVTNTSDFNGLLNSINASPNRATYYAAFDLNRDGVISAAELGQALRYSGSAGNPDGAINYDRIIQSSAGLQETSSEGQSVYLQDQIRLGDFTLNLGVRAEEWSHVATTGEDIFTFDWEIAPRISGTWDIGGQGRQKIAAYYGRYYDPIRNNLTNFAGTLSGTVLEEQTFVNGEWLTYRTRGGPVVLDATFAPTTETPYTDDYMVTYQRDLGSHMAVELSVYHRETKNIIEDYDLALYTTDYPGDPNAPGSLYLPPSYFGYDEIPTGINFFIATLEGGKRELDGAEIIFRKRLQNRWQGLFSYTYGDATGTNNSDSNADFAGDVLWLDPRAPNVEGRQPGSIEHIAKLQGSYHLDMGVTLGATYRWNSGAYQTRSQLAFRRHLPVQGEEFVFNGVSDQWVEAGSVGGVKNPSYGVLDLSAGYNHSFGEFGTEFFLSVFNALDDQATVFTQDLASGSPPFGSAITWVPPRSITLGVRLSYGR